MSLRPSRLQLVLRLWCASLLLPYFAGCSAYRAAAIPDDQRGDDAPVVKVGMPARIHLQSGATIMGVICAVDETAVTVEAPPGNYGREAREVPVAEIDHVEVQASTEWGNASALVFGTAAVACAGLMVLFLAFGEVK